MSQFVGDIVTLEFGVNILACVNEIMDNIKALRQDIKNKSGKEIPLIRLKDNVDLKENEYRVIIKGIVAKQELLENITDDKKVIMINDGFTEAIINNMQSVIEQ